MAINHFHLHFQIGQKNYDIDFVPRKDLSYALQGEKEGIEIISKCLSTGYDQNNISETRKELRVKLWQLGAKEISFSKEIDRIGQEILGMRAPFHIKGSLQSVCSCLEKNYVFPDVARECSKYIRHEFEKGSYDAISDPEAFAQTITADIRHLSDDKHIEIKVKHPQDQSRPETEQEKIADLKSITYGLGTYKNLLSLSFIKEIPSHIGYLEVHSFHAVDKNDAEFKKFPNAVQETRAAMTKAMEELLLQKPKSIIIDLRNNGGGSPSGVQLLCSYFLPEKTPLNTIRWRKGNGICIEEKNALSYEEIPQEKRWLTTPLFILMSQYTFSAGEEFANNMKALNRATLIGEVTKGGANPGRAHLLNDHFEIFVADGQSINPHNGSNWEGIGVIPDLVVPASEALDHSVYL